MPRARGSSRRGSGRGRRSGRARRPRRGPELAPDPDRQSAELCEQIADEARSRFVEIDDGLEAQLCASSLVDAWHFGPLAPPGFDTDEIFGVGAVRALERAGDAGALAALRALAAVGSEPVAATASEAADELAGEGVEDPVWAAEVANVRPGRGLVVRDPAFDDVVDVFIEFESPGGDPYVIGVLIDHNLGGIAKDLLVCGSIAEAERAFADAPAEFAGEGEVELVPTEPVAAAVRVREALARTAITLDAPVSDDFGSLRALAEAHVRALAAGEETPEEEEASAAVCDEAVDGFFESPEGEALADDEDAFDLAMLAVDFAAGYVGGVDRPLRWSPAVVELFMTWYLPAKAVREPAFFERVPELLERWVRYAARRRGLDRGAIDFAAGAVGEFAAEMLEAIGDEKAWGPAKALGMAALEAGVDLTDEAELDAFFERWDERRAA